MGARVSRLGIGGRGGEQGIGVGGSGEDGRGERVGVGVEGVGEGIGHGAPVVGGGVGSGGVGQDEGLHLFLGGVEVGLLETLVVLRAHHLRKFPDPARGGRGRRSGNEEDLPGFDLRFLRQSGVKAREEQEEEDDDEEDVKERRESCQGSEA